MKKIFFTVISLFFACYMYGQNNSPIALSDSIYLDVNDSISFTNVVGKILVNDSDPDFNAIVVDTALYSGNGYFNFYAITPSHTSVRFDYKPALNFWGKDSVQYIIRDNGVPIKYDTAYIYFFVKYVSTQLDLNNINAKIGFRSLFKSENPDGGFEAPKGSNRHSFYAANLWLSGKNQDSIYANVQTFGNTNFIITESEERAGPIMDSVYYNFGYDEKWDRVWKVNFSDIINHHANWDKPTYVVPQVFLDWPAHGDTTKGQAFYLAPFVDNNGDGIYNPYDGDFPKIKGQQAVYFIYNDERITTMSSRPMSSEVHGMAYAYNCVSDSAIKQYNFYRLYSL